MLHDDNMTALRLNRFHGLQLLHKNLMPFRNKTLNSNWLYLTKQGTGTGYTEYINKEEL